MLDSSTLPPSPLFSSSSHTSQSVVWQEKNKLLGVFFGALSAGALGTLFSKCLRLVIPQKGLLSSVIWEGYG